VKRALLIAAHLMLMEHEVYLRERDLAINPRRWRERVGRDALKNLLRICEPTIFAFDCGGRPVAERPVNFAQGWIETCAAEIRVDYRITTQELAHVSVVRGLEGLIVRCIRGG